MSADPASTPRKLEYVRLDSVTAAPRNPKGHDTTGIARAIKHHGFGEVPLRDERTGRLVAGHGRYTQLVAMRDSGATAPDGILVDPDGEWLMPVITGWASRSDEDAEAYLVGSNRLTTKGGWDDRGLTEMLEDLAAANLLELTGYDQADLDALLADLNPAVDEIPPAFTDPDDAPEPPAEPVCAVGDVWELGPHRLTVGDSTDVNVWETLLEGRRADMVWTDPPYGVAYTGKTADALTIENDALDEDGLRDFLRAAFAATYTATRPGAAWYIASPPGPLHLVFGGLLHELGVLRQTLIWVKDQFVMGRSDYHYRHEPLFYGWTPGAAHHPVPDRTQDTVHEVPRPKRSADHPTMKPVALIERHITNSTDPGQLVVDPFGGSGSTLLAAHAAGRVAALIELDPRYADVICRRYQEHTGIKPTRNGQPHDFTASNDA